jgi:hypothetical protein
VKAYEALQKASGFTVKPEERSGFTHIIFTMPNLPLQGELQPRGTGEAPRRALSPTLAPAARPRPSLLCASRQLVYRAESAERPAPHPIRQPGTYKSAKILVSIYKDPIGLRRLPCGD